MHPVAFHVEAKLRHSVVHTITQIYITNSQRSHHITTPAPESKTVAIVPPYLRRDKIFNYRLPLLRFKHTTTTTRLIYKPYVSVVQHNMRFIRIVVQ